MLALDRRLRIVWLSEAIRHLCDDASTMTGRPLRDLLGRLAVEPGDTQRTALEQGTALEQALAELRANGSTLRTRSGVGRTYPLQHFELSAFRTSRAPGEDRVVCVARLYQLFANLIGNAVEHRSEDRPGRIEGEPGVGTRFIVFLPESAVPLDPVEIVRHPLTPTSADGEAQP